MKQYLEDSLNKYHLSLLNDNFSPITKTSAAMCLDYIDFFKNNTTKSKEPFFIGFPSKGNYALWISILIELNLLFEDQYYESSNLKNLVPNQKVELYGAVGKYLRIAPENTSCLKIEFKDQAINIPIERDKKYLKIVDDNRKLNLSKNYNSGRKLFFEERNILSKILYPNSINEIFEYNKAVSKVLLITGRGNSNNFRQQLSDNRIEDSSLGKVFRTDINLIIRPDLEDFLNSFSENYSNKFASFIELIGRLKTETTIPELKTFLIDIENWTYIDIENLNLFNTIYEDYIDLEKKLDHVKKKFPGLTPISEFDFKVVVINDIIIYNSYTELIDKIVQKGIPVIFIYEQKSYNKNDLLTTKDILTRKLQAYFLCWTSQKVKSFNSTILEFIDNTDYENTISYLSKKITIQCSDSIPIDSIFIDALSIVKNITNLEIRKLCYKYLNPIIFNIRGSNSKSKFISNLINEFEDKLGILKSYLNHDEFESIDNLIIEVKKYTTNNKYIPIDNNLVYSYESSYNSLIYYTPTTSTKQKVLKDNAIKILFSGFPGNEFTEHPLIRSIFEYNYQQIDINCWQNEGMMTFNYLKNKIANGLNLECLPFYKAIDKTFLLNTKDDILNEISTKIQLLNFKNNVSDILNIEDIFSSIKVAKFAEYSIESTDIDLEPTECNIIYFSNDKFMFIPKDGNKVLVATEGKDGGYLISRIDPVNLHKGMYFFDVDYSVGLKDLLVLSNINENEALLIIEKLSKWRNALTYINNYCNAKGISIVVLLNSIKNENLDLLQKSNPSNANIRYWLKDTEILSLSRENLFLISKTAEKLGYKFNFDEAEENYLLRNKVKGKLNSLNASVKNRIQVIYNKKDINLYQHFEYSENNVKIIVNVYQIMMIDIEDGFYVDYSKTRKLLC